MSRPNYDPDQEERARRIREEIQRKIAERRGKAASPAAAPPPPLPRFDPFRPVFQEDARPTPPPLRRSETAGIPPLRPPEPSSAREPVPVHDDSAALERQRRLAEQLEQLEEQRVATRRAARQIGDDSASASASATTGGVIGARSMAAELRDPRALRRAFVMSEVLSPPVALR